MSLTLAVTADLHWDHRRGQDETRQLADFLASHVPDVLVLAGDLGTGEHFDACLSLFDGLPCRKALVPGNHDLWVSRSDVTRDSLLLYERELPRAAAAHGFHYLDAGPLLLPDEGLAVVGTVNWYDYSWAIDDLRRLFPGEEERLRSKRFTRGRYNDAKFVRWPTDDVAFTARVVAAFERQLDEALAQVPRAVVVTHHPPLLDLCWPVEGPPDLDTLLWYAFSGNRALEALLTRHAARVPLGFCGHTHRQRETTLGPLHGHNVGGDYHFKRLLWVEWPAATVTAHQFGDPGTIG
jgi:3',5'-cyclic AMP phosphodiesterase CpdA